ncbi:MAG: hypothetical protein LBO03_01900 [Acidaminococcales bacterium]|jgi:hypothetical protein|nr:hypothetical protein [Acidaminococcales bacterium]
MGFSGTAKPEEQRPAAAPASAAPAAPLSPAVGGDLIAVVAAAIAAYDGGGEISPIIGRLSSPGWTNYARIETVTTRDQMF